MSLRQSVNQHSGLIVLAVVVAIAIAGWVAYRSVAPPPRAGGQVYFTDDDGKSFFPVGASALSPMQRNGKTAYRAYVFTCPDGKQFVGYMERMPDDLIKLIEKAKSDPNNVTNQEKSKLMLAAQLKQTKKPGGEKWESASAMGVKVGCPDGSSATIVD